MPKGGGGGLVVAAESHEGDDVGVAQEDGDGNEGGGLFEFQTPSPPPPFPSKPPKFWKPSFSNLRSWGEMLLPKALKIFFCPAAGVFFFTLCVLTQNT